MWIDLCGCSIWESAEHLEISCGERNLRNDLSHCRTKQAVEVKSDSKKCIYKKVCQLHKRTLPLFRKKASRLIISVPLWLFFPHKISFSATEEHNDESSMPLRLQSEMSVLEQEHQARLH